MNQIRKNLDELKTMIELMNQDERFMSDIQDVAKKTHDELAKGGKLLLAGNGGSAAEAQHIAAEFVNHFSFDRPPLAAIALTTDTSVLTSIGNDRNFDQIFSRQLRALGRPGDVLFAYSTSGKSKNILEVIQAARSMKIYTVGFTGLGGEHLKKICDAVISIPSSRTPHIQEGHLIVGHIISEIVEQQFFSRKD
jgi:D-sedoheptulose 7-phosphate isomerase